MAKVTTLDEIYHPLMNAPTIRMDRCAVCGRTWPLNQHHIVFRSQGQLVRDGKVIEKPTITLCGMGNDLYGMAPDGTRVMWCHGKAHHRLMYFRWVPHPEYANAGHLEVIELDEPAKYEEVLATEEGWRPL